METITAHVAINVPVSRPVEEVVAFFAGEGKGLFELLDALCEPVAAQAVVELRALHDQKKDPGEVARLISVVLDGLASVSHLVLEHAASHGYGPRDMHAAVRWYGRRVTDLHSRFKV
jgi:hypothetical protein